MTGRWPFAFVAKEQKQTFKQTSTSGTGMDEVGGGWNSGLERCEGKGGGARGCGDKVVVSHNRER